MCSVVSVSAQSDIVSMKDAISIFKNHAVANARKVLDAEGYDYKGVTTTFGSDYTWTKNVSLSKHGLPTAFKKGNSSIVYLDKKGSDLTIYVFNQTAYKNLQNQLRKLGYEKSNDDKQTDSEFFFKDNSPSVLFSRLSREFPYSIMITK